MAKTWSDVKPKITKYLFGNGHPTPQLVTANGTISEGDFVQVTAGVATISATTTNEVASGKIFGIALGDATAGETLMVEAIVPGCVVALNSTDNGVGHLLATGDIGDAVAIYNLAGQWSADHTVAGTAIARVLGPYGDCAVGDTNAIVEVMFGSSHLYFGGVA